MLTLHENGGASLRLSSGDSILLEDQLLQYMMREAFKQAGPSQPATSQIQAANMLRLTFAMANIPNAVADHINKSAGGADAGVVLANILLREKTIVATLLDPDTGGTASMPIPESILENLRKAVAAKRSIGSP